MTRRFPTGADYDAGRALAARAFAVMAPHLADSDRNHYGKTTIINETVSLFAWAIANGLIGGTSDSAEAIATIAGLRDKLARINALSAGV